MTSIERHILSSHRIDWKDKWIQAVIRSSFNRSPLGNDRFSVTDQLIEHLMRHRLDQ